MLLHAAGSQPAAQSVRLSWCLRQVSARLLRDRGSARQGATFRGVQAEGWARVRSRGHLLAAHTCAPKSDADDFRVRPRSVALVPEESARAAPERSGWRPNKPDQWRLSSLHNGARLHPEASRSRDLLRHSRGRSPSDPCAHREGHLQPRAAAPMACGGLCARAAARAAGMEFVTLNELPGIISDGIRPDRKKITAARG